jgi:hypothetical protein
MEQALEESREEFKKQFDRSNPNYHGGDPRPVKVNEATVPDNMRTNQLEWSEAPPTEVVDYGPEYTRVEKMRNDLGELKKLLVGVVPPLESIVRLKVKLATSPDDQKPKVQAQIDQDIQKRDAAIDALLKFGELEWFQPGKEYASQQAVIQEIGLNARHDFVNAEELFEFGSQAKREGQKLFAEQKVLLQRLKDIKKEKK